MSDVVVTVPKQIWYTWIEEGDSVGTPYSGETWGFFTSGMKPNIVPGERVYVVAHGRLRGYAPLTKLVFEPVAGSFGRVTFGRAGGAVAVTIDRPIQGFRGWRYRNWEYRDEKPFPNWITEGVSLKR